MADDEQEEQTDQDADAEPSPRGEDVGQTDRDTVVYEVPVEIFAVLGTALVPIAQLLKMGRGAVLELDRKVGDPVDIFVNRQMVARGEVSVRDDRLGVTINETVKYVR